MHYLLPLKMETMTSLEIATLTGKLHKHVMRDIREMIAALEKDGPDLDRAIKSCTYTAGNGKQEVCFILDEISTLTLVTGYDIVLRDKVITRWKFIEEQIRIIQLREGTKKHQLEAMEALKGLLPPGLEGIPLSYIKANTVVNKATSNLFGFPKTMSKADMSTDMLEARDKILDDYIKLYEVLEDNHEVKAALYRKYQPCRLELKS